MKTPLEKVLHHLIFNLTVLPIVVSPIEKQDYLKRQSCALNCSRTLYFGEKMEQVNETALSTNSVTSQSAENSATLYWSHRA